MPADVAKSDADSCVSLAFRIRRFTGHEDLLDSLVSNETLYEIPYAAAVQLIAIAFVDADEWDVALSRANEFLNTVNTSQILRLQSDTAKHVHLIISIMEAP